MPIVAFMAGRFMDEMPGMSFGHAGTIVEGKEDTAAEKIVRLAEAGITVAEEISEIPEIMKAKLAAAQERGMRADAIFIGIEVDDAAIAKHPELPAHLTQVCPVDIYREAGGGGLRDRRRERRRVRAVRPVPRRRRPTAPSRCSSSTTTARSCAGS